MKKKMFKIKFTTYLCIFFLVASCGAVREGFSNQKKDNTDEFLVKKKSPLVLPPDYDQLPIPNQEIDNENKDDNKVEKLISKDTKTKNLENEETSNTNFENFVLDQIKK